MKRTRPLALRSCGPVKTSPLGMLRLPSELTHVRPATPSVRSVPSASRRSSRASRRRAISRSWKARRPPHGRHRVGLVEEQRAAHEGREVLERHARLLGERLGRPQRRAPALLHRRLADRAPRAGVARDPIGVDADELAHVAGRLDAQQRVDLLGLGEREVGVVVEVALARVLVEGGRLPGQLDAQQRPRVALEDRALQLEQQRRRQRGRAHEHGLAGLDVEAVAGQQVREGGRAPARSRRLEVGEVLGEVLAQDVADPAPLVLGGDAQAHQQLALALGGHVGDHPAHGQALEQQLGRALPRVLLGEHVAVQRRRGTARRVFGVSAPRSTSTSPCGEAYSLSGALSFSTLPRARPRLPMPYVVCSRALELPADVAGQRLGVARPTRRPAPSRRACGSRRAPARCRG